MITIARTTPQVYQKYKIRGFDKTKSAVAELVRSLGAGKDICRQIYHVGGSLFLAEVLRRSRKKMIAGTLGSSFSKGIEAEYGDVLHILERCLQISEALSPEDTRPKDVHIKSIGDILQDLLKTKLLSEEEFRNADSYLKTLLIAKAEVQSDDPATDPDPN